MFETYREGKNPGRFEFYGMLFLKKRRVLRIRPKDEYDQPQKGSVFGGSTRPRCPSPQKHPDFSENLRKKKDFSRH
jgi:hypothetical protein